MDVVIDLSFINEFLALDPGPMLWQFFITVGWIPVAILFLMAAKVLWLSYIRGKWGAKVNFILLAIDVPRDNAQSPLAVENLFTYFAGAHGSITFYDKWFEGKYQLSFSLETISIEGYTQFLIHTPEQFRNLVESAVYSQYPDAEISQVEDYVDNIPHSYPDEEWDVWGSEFLMARNTMYPIKTYKEFEHQLGPTETHFRDPMAALMDLCGSLGPGEQLWYQIILIPIGFDWMEAADDEVDKLLQKKPKHKKGLMMKFLEWLGDASEAIFQIWGEVEDKGDKDDSGLSMMELTPKQKKQVEGLHRKVAKLGFEFKIRMVYAAKKDVKQVSKVANGFVGFMKQFAALDLNNIKPDVGKTMTSTDYFLSQYRLNQKKSNIVRNYASRNDWAGRLPGIMNVEELATIWHFPIGAVVKAPLVQMAPGRKAEAPSSLPLDELNNNEDDQASFEAELFADDNNKEIASSTNMDDELDEAPPNNLPIV